MHSFALFSFSFSLQTCIEVRLKLTSMLQYLVCDLSWSANLCMHLEFPPLARFV